MKPLYFATRLEFNAPDGGVPRDDLRKVFLHGGQRMAKVQNGEEILRKVSAPLCRAHERYRRQTDLR